MAISGELSRSFLLIIARTGFALSVTGCVVGLFGGLTSRFGFNNGVQEQTLSSSGVTICLHDGSSFGSIEPAWEYLFPHWLNVAFFVAFYVMLRLAYRGQLVEDSS